MKNLFLSTVILFAPLFSSVAQTINKTYNSSVPILKNNHLEIQGDEKHVSIQVDVIYNAIPDGYIITYTTTFIGTSIEDVELKANQKMDELKVALQAVDVSSKEVTVDILAIDPIFNFESSDNIHPEKYRITQNVSINIKDINLIGKLTKICLSYNLYDIINAQAYIVNTDAIQDSLDHKAIEILNQKKTLCEEVGIKLNDGKIEFSNYKDVFYPSEKYLKSYITNSTYYSHHSSQNTSLNLERRVEIDNYYDYNLKHADFVFNSNNNQPVIQFYSQLIYGYKKKDSEEEMREKIKKEEEAKPTKEFYMIDNEGNLVKIATK
jgi:uncharacterized protein YggE